MRKFGKRIAAAGLCATLAMTSLTGCGAKADDVVATMDGTELTLGEAVFLLRYNQAQTQSYLGALFGDDQNLFEQDLTGSGTAYGETLKSSILSNLEEMTLLEQHMSDYGVELTEEETAAIEEATQEFLAANSEDTLDEMMATEETVSRILTLYTIKSKMETAIEADVDTEVSDEEAAQKTIQYAYFSIPETEEESESETGTEDESAEESGTEAVSETESENAAETEAVSEAESESAAETETEAVSETESENAAETETEAVSETESESAAETETEAVSEAESESAAETETEAVSEAESESAAETETEAASETESGTEADSETESETETETEESAEKKETREQVQSIIDAVLGGETLEDAVAAVDSDKTVTDYSYGDDDDSLNEALKTAADTLSDGEIYAEPVATDYGFYVVQMVTTFDEEATEEHKLEIIEDRKDELYESVVTEWEPESFVINDDVWDEVDFNDIVTLMTEASTEAETETETGTGTEALSDTEAETGTEAASETETNSETETEEASETESESES